MKRLAVLLIALVVCMAQAVIIQASPQSAVGFECFGAAAEAWRYKGPEFILAGPFETGKTFAALNKYHALLCKYPSRGLMVRKTYQSLVHSAVVTYEKKVLPISPDDPNSPIQKYGGIHPELYVYPNGSELILGGMDKPAKFLSGEYDWAYVNQAEELVLNDWEILSGRVTGRAGNAPYSQLFGDCNPADPMHWILHRDRLKVFYSKHEDNPRLFDHTTDTWTAQGVRTLGTLDALTGVRYKRGRLGQWVAAEGQVYEEFDPAIHLIDRFEIPAQWRRIRAVDFGYTNPFCCAWYAIDGDGRMYLYREIYRTQRLVEDHAKEIVRLSAGERIEATVADHDAEDRATLDRHGIPTIPAQKAISVGLQAVSARLRKAGDGKPRLFILRDSLVDRDPALADKFQPTSTLDEFPVYMWQQAKDGKPIKEVPVDLNNHGMDQLRYAVMQIDQNNEARIYVGSRRV